jgi:hypothetical protein
VAAVLWVCPVEARMLMRLGTLEMKKTVVERVLTNHSLWTLPPAEWRSPFAEVSVVEPTRPWPFVLESEQLPDFGFTTPVTTEDLLVELD